MPKFDFCSNVSAFCCALLTVSFVGCGKSPTRNSSSNLKVQSETLLGAPSPESTAVLIPSVIEGTNFVSATDGSTSTWGLNHCKPKVVAADKPTPVNTVIAPPANDPVSVADAALAVASAVSNAMTAAGALGPDPAPTTPVPTPAPIKVPEPPCIAAWPSEGIGLDYHVMSEGKGLQNYSIDIRLSSIDKDAYIAVESPPGEFRGNVSGYSAAASKAAIMGGTIETVVQTLSGIPLPAGEQVVRLIFHGVTAVSYLDFHRDFDETVLPSVPGTTPAPVKWSKADMTNYTSYPDPLSEECIEYNGCTWAGMFAAIEGQMPESWVKAHNIIAVHSKHFAKYKLKTFRIKQGKRQITAKVYDYCSDSDCDGCCTENSKKSGFLIDLESYGLERSGIEDGVVQWRCLDCDESPVPLAPLP